MSHYVHWQLAQARAEEARRLAATAWPARAQRSHSRARRRWRR